MLNYELDRARAKEEAALKNKHTAWDAYNDVRELTDKAHDTLQSVGKAKREAKDKMNTEYDLIKFYDEAEKQAWEEYRKTRNYLNSLIEPIRAEADAEHHAMQECFAKAADEYNLGNKAKASEYSQEGHKHKERRNELNSEVGRLCHEIVEAKKKAQEQSAMTNKSAFMAAKSEYNHMKECYDEAYAEYRRLRDEREDLRCEYEFAEQTHEQVKENLQKLIEEEAAEKEKNSHKEVPEYYKWPFKWVKFSSKKS